MDQDEALIADDNSKYTGLFWQMVAVEQELKSRKDDQRRALFCLYDHPNPNVRLQAAKVTLALAPQAARGILQAIRESGELFYGLDAG